MKYGIEVEGCLKGTPMIFCDADQIQKENGVIDVLDAMRDRSVHHVYISDNANVLDYQRLGELFHSWIVTLDCTQVKGPRPPNVSLMLREPTFEMIGALTKRDQIKFEKDRVVYVWSMQDVHETWPEDFAGDIEL